MSDIIRVLAQKQVKGRVGLGRNPDQSRSGLRWIAGLVASDLLLMGRFRISTFLNSQTRSYQSGPI
ncbi:hypothetical protein [Spirosoma fluminis]